MKVLRLMLALAAALAAQTVLGAVWPEAARYVDIMLLPVVWYALATSQRAGMLVGCLGGLLQDAWFQAGAFGLNGFKKTAVGWLLGSLGARFDVRRPSACFAFGAVAALVDALLDIGLRSLLDRGAPGAWTAAPLIQALVGGLLLALAFRATAGVGERRGVRRGG